MWRRCRGLCATRRTGAEMCNNLLSLETKSVASQLFFLFFFALFLLEKEALCSVHLQLYDFFCLFFV